VKVDTQQAKRRELFATGPGENGVRDGNVTVYWRPFGNILFPYLELTTSNE